MKSRDDNVSEKISTGIQGLDEMLNGGFQNGRVTLVTGGPGTGKTILALQVLVAAAKSNVKGVYLTLEEPLKQIRENVSSFRWDIENLEAEKSIILLEAPVLFEGTNKQRSDDNIQSISKIIKTSADLIDAKFVVLDPLTSITVNEQNASVKRRKIADLFNFFRGCGYTSVLISESAAAEGEFYIEDFLADGILRLGKSIVDFNLVRTLRIEKMRGAKHDEQPRRYIIDEKGFTVYSTEPIRMQRMGETR